MVKSRDVTGRPPRATAPSQLQLDLAGSEKPRQLDPADAAGPQQRAPQAVESLAEELARFDAFGTKTIVSDLEMPVAGGSSLRVRRFVNEFWTARQRQASSLHEVSYRACFKPQLPRFFIQRLTEPGGRVYDPFMGRGTTPIEAALLGRRPAGCDVNPLSVLLAKPRLAPPPQKDVAARVQGLDLSVHDEWPEDLLTFYHPETLAEICALKRYFLRRTASGEFDAVDDWLRMVAINRLTGHSAGFFSVYTLPPNQATSVKAQRRINERRNQTPPRRAVRQILLKKSRQLLGDVTPEVEARLRNVAGEAILMNAACDRTPELADDSVDLVVTSPPFLDVVDYATDNWLRCWFAGIDSEQVRLTVPRKVEVWAEAMAAVFRELFRVVRPGGHVAFEVGEVKHGAIRLEEVMLPCGCAAGFEPRLILINDQEFTKTSHCWGVDNNAKGTNTNRIVLFRKPGQYAASL